MDALLKNFSLQNLLRQFFCGAVFFVPLYLFSPYENLSLHTFSEVSSFLIFVFVSLSAIIGTIIYHIEKNLYSYFVQLVFESIHRRIRSSVLPCVIVALLITVALSPLSNDRMSAVWISFCFFVVLLVVAVLFRGDFTQVLSRTRKCWIIEGVQLDDKSSAVSWQKRAIAVKVAEWSTFIHCVQCCCLSWLLGCACCYFLFIEPAFNSSFSQFCRAWLCLEQLIFSVKIAISLLFLELVFDWHRYQHVIAMTSGPFFPKSDLDN